MADHTEIDIIIKDGEVRHIYDDKLIDFQNSLGRVITKRASHVEPCEGGWDVDLSPVSPGTHLGPFATRNEALKAEVAWLNEHGIPTEAT